MNIVRPESNLKMPEDAKLVHKGILFKVYQWEQELFDGSKTTFEKLVRNDTVNVLAVQDGKIVLTHQEQPNVKPFIGNIGGKIDENEDPLEAAKRELKEESGLESTDWVLWKSVQLYEKIDWASYIFMARDCTQTAQPEPDAGEKIKLVKYSFDDFLLVAKQENYRDIEVTLMITRAEAEPNGLTEFRRLLEDSTP